MPARVFRSVKAVNIIWLVGAAATLSVFGVACGSAAAPAPPSKAQLATAESNAVQACGQMLTLGNDVVTNQTLTSTKAKATLAQAAHYASLAAKVDPTDWKSLQANIAQITNSLETDHRANLKSELTELGNLCAPLAVNGNS